MLLKAYLQVEIDHDYFGIKRVLLESEQELTFFLCINCQPVLVKGLLISL